MGLLDFLFGGEKHSRICPTFSAGLSSEELKRLDASGYMSSQGVAFECGSCDYYKDGFCNNKEILSSVQTDGCCNYYTREGVHG